MFINVFVVLMGVRGVIKYLGCVGVWLWGDWYWGDFCFFGDLEWFVGRGCVCIVGWGLGGLLEVFRILYFVWGLMDIWIFLDFFWLEKVFFWMGGSFWVWVMEIWWVLLVVIIWVIVYKWNWKDNKNKFNKNLIVFCYVEVFIFILCKVFKNVIIF